MVPRTKTGKKIQTADDKHWPLWLCNSYRNVPVYVYRPLVSDLKPIFNRQGIMEKHQVFLKFSNTDSDICIPLYDQRKCIKGLLEATSLSDKILLDIEKTILTALENSPAHDFNGFDPLVCRVILPRDNEYICGVVVYKDKQANRQLYLIPV